MYQVSPALSTPLPDEIVYGSRRVKEFIPSFIHFKIIHRRCLDCRCKYCKGSYII
jgi:hypothetical protein